MNPSNHIQMKFSKLIRNGQILQILICFIFVILMAESCQKDKTVTNYTYLKTSANIEDIPSSNVASLFTLLSISYPESQPIISKCIYTVAVYKITYTTTFKNSSITASGLICIPKSAGTYPILSFQNGTNTKNTNAPSLNYNNNLFSLIEGVASMGYIVVIPDYIGFGASSNILHPYHHRESNNSAVIDMIKAAEEFLTEKPAGVTGNGKLFLLGYSQGGWATLSALNELEKNPISTELIQAVSCGAGSYDLTAMTNYLIGIQTFPTPLYLPYFLQSHIKNGFLNTTLSTVFKEPYASRIPSLFNDSLDGGQIDGQLTSTIADLLTDSIRLNFSNSTLFADLRNELKVNSVPAWHSSSRIFFAAGTGDLDVPSFISEQTYNAFRDLGADTSQVKLTLFPGLTHETALIPWGLATINWFNSLK